MKKKQIKMIARLSLSALFFGAGIFTERKTGISWLFFLVSYLAAGYDIPLRALRNLRHGQLFDENFLMTVATIGAIGCRAFEEAAAVMLFYQVGEWFSSYAVDKSRKSIADLMDIHPEYANVLRDGKEEKLDPSQVLVGERIVVKPGEKVPLDGVVAKGYGGLDTRAITGESLPLEVKEGEVVLSGSINLNGVLEVEVTKLFEDSTVSRILELVENAGVRKARAENFITRFARVYTPLVVAFAVALGIFVPLLTGGNFEVWIYRACTFLVVSCPCALVISVPLSFFGGLGAASKQGILMKGSNYLEVMASLETVVFDKTGTLTTGKFQVTEIEAVEGTQEELLKMAAYGEFHSNHPIARSVLEAYGQPVNEEEIGQVEEFPGYGIRAEVQEGGGLRKLFIGNARLMEREGISFSGKMLKAGTVLYLADGNRYLGCISISDTVRKDVPEALKSLRKAGVKTFVMLSGDKPEAAEAIGKSLLIDRIYGGLLPGDKVSKLEELLAEKKEGKTLAFVGDGMNDAPVLARADVGIAMGGIGTDAAVEAADVVIMTDEPSKLADGILIGRKTLGIVRQNIVFAIGVKVLVLVLSAMGLATMWAAVFADVGVSVLAILNAVRALNYQKNREIH